LYVPEAVEDALVLTSYAFEARYPGLAEPVSEEEYRQAVELAQTVVHWADEVIGRGQG
jgi:HEPN domain-containing protein